MASRKKGELKRINQRDFKNDPKKAKLLIPETGRREIITINHQLDHDCFVKIFSYLPVLDRLEIRKVCKKWKEAVDMSWPNVKKIDTENLQILLHKKESTLEELLNNCCKYLTHLTIDNEYSWMTDVLKNNCRNIVYFDVELKLSEYAHNLCEIIGSMTKLKILKVTVRDKLEFRGLWNKLIEILPADIEEIHLFKVKITYLSFNYTECCLELRNKFTNLRCLTLKNFLLTTATIESILLNKNSLIYLDLHGCELPEECPITLFTQLVNLEHLNLSGVRYLKDNIITEIAHNCQKLKYLSINCFDIQRSIFRELKYLNNLEHLEFPHAVNESDDDDNLMADVVDNCKKLKYLNVEEGKNFSTLDIEAITKLNNLQYLNIRWARVDSQSFINIANNCLELKKLNVFLHYFSEIALEKLTNLKKLEILNFAYCENLTGNLLSKIVNNCKNLVCLDLSECYNVTEDSLIQVGKLDNLKILNISHIKNVPIEMFDYFRKLEELKCKYCPTITDDVIFKVIDNCLKISNLNLYETGITVDTLVHAEERKFPYKFLNIHVEQCLHGKYLKLNRKPSHYLKIN